MKAIFNFFERIVRRDTAESSKRFTALIMIILICYMVVRFTDYLNFLDVLNYLLVFVSALLGVAALETVAFEKIHKDTETEIISKTQKQEEAKQ